MKIAAIIDAWLKAMIECICTEHLPVCVLNPDGSRSLRQPYTYGGAA